MKVGKAGKAGPHAAYIAREGEYAHRREKGEALEACEAGNMPLWAQANPLEFWRAADAHERANGTTYREMEIALPRELSAAQRIELVRAFVTEELGDRHAYQWAIHTPQAADGGEQPHAHLMFSERQRDGIERDPEQYFKRYNAKNPERGGARKGYGPHAGQTLTAAERKADLVALRSRWEAMCNAHLERAGLAERIDMRSHAERQTGQVPERKQLPSAWRGEGRAQVIEFRAARAEVAQAAAELRLAVPDTGAEIIHLEAERQRRQQRESERARRPDESALGAQIRNMKADAEERAKSAPPNAFAQEVEQALAERRKAKAQECERGRIQHGEGGVIRHTPVEASEKLIHEQIAQARERREQERQAERERLRAAERHQEQQRIERMNAAELRAEIERQRPAPVAELVERDPAVIEATRTHRTLAGQVQALQGRANEAHREAQAWREAHPIRAKAHDAGVMRAAYLDERAQVIEQARAEYQKVAPQATRAREVAESVRNATTTRIAQEQAPALARIRALEQRAAELERIERERQAQALREQQAEGEARLLVRDMREMADSLRCGAPGWTEDGHQLQALYAPENKDALTMVEGLAALPLEEQRDYVAEQLVARLAKDPAARLRLAEQVERVQRGPEQDHDHDYGMSL
ncbi:MobA/MobL family protein [Aeromonas caviae]|nr:MobA/MobL family protein [Aeromonas caviae]